MKQYSKKAIGLILLIVITSLVLAFWWRDSFIFPLSLPA